MRALREREMRAARRNLSGSRAGEPSMIILQPQHRSFQVVDTPLTSKCSRFLLREMIITRVLLATIRLILFGDNSLPMEGVFATLTFMAVNLISEEETDSHVLNASDKLDWALLVVEGILQGAVLFAVLPNTALQLFATVMAVALFLTLGVGLRQSVAGVLCVLYGVYLQSIAAPFKPLGPMWGIMCALSAGLGVAIQMHIGFWLMYIRQEMCAVVMHYAIFYTIGKGSLASLLLRRLECRDGPPPETPLPPAIVSWALVMAVDRITGVNIMWMFLNSLTGLQLLVCVFRVKLLNHTTSVYNLTCVTLLLAAIYQSVPAQLLPLLANCSSGFLVFSMVKERVLSMIGFTFLALAIVQEISLDAMERRARPSSMLYRLMCANAAAWGFHGICLALIVPRASRVRAGSPQATVSLPVNAATAASTKQAVPCDQASQGERSTCSQESAGHSKDSSDTAAQVVELVDGHTNGVAEESDGDGTCPEVAHVPAPAPPAPAPGKSNKGKKKGELERERREWHEAQLREEKEREEAEEARRKAKREKTIEKRRQQAQHREQELHAQKERQRKEQDEADRLAEVQRERAARQEEEKRRAQEKDMRRLAEKERAERERQERLDREAEAKRAAAAAKKAAEEAATKRKNDEKAAAAKAKEAAEKAEAARQELARAEEARLQSAREAKKKQLADKGDRIPKPKSARLAAAAAGSPTSPAASPTGAASVSLPKPKSAMASTPTSTPHSPVKASPTTPLRSKVMAPAPACVDDMHAAEPAMPEAPPEAPPLPASIATPPFHTPPTQPQPHPDADSDGPQDTGHVLRVLQALDVLRDSTTTPPSHDDRQHSSFTFGHGSQPSTAHQSPSHGQAALAGPRFNLDALHQACTDSNQNNGNGFGSNDRVHMTSPSAQWGNGSGSENHQQQLQQGTNGRFTRDHMHFAPAPQQSMPQQQQHQQPQPQQGQQTMYLYPVTNMGPPMGQPQPMLVQYAPAPTLLSPVNLTPYGVPHGYSQAQHQHNTEQ